MKPALIFVAASILVLSNLTASAGDGLGARVDWKIRIQAATEAARNAIIELEEQPTVIQVELLSKQIGADPKQHQHPSTSRRVALDLAKQELAASFDLQMQRILARANTGIGQKIIESDIEPRIPDFGRVIDQAATRFEREHFETMFKSARARAVARQRDGLETIIAAPPQAEVDNALVSNPQWLDHQSVFFENLKTRAVPTELALFDENDSVINAAINSVLAEIGKQYRAQQSAARSDVSDDRVPTNCITFDAIQRHALTALRSTTQDLNRNYSTGYDVFRVVADQLSKDARRLEASRLESSINEATFPISQQSLAARIESSPGDHRLARDSQAIFESALVDLGSRYVLAWHMRNAELEGSTEKTARHRIDELLKRDDFVMLIRKAIRRQLQPVLRKARQHVAKRQIASHFGQLGQWRPSGTDIATLYDHGILPSDFEDSMKLLRGDDHTRLGPNTFLVETEQIVTKQIRSQSEAGVKALRDQLLILKEMERDQAQQLTLDVTAGIEKEQIIRNWTDGLSDEWKHSEYSNLFERTRQEVEKTVSKHYNEIRLGIANRSNSGTGVISSSTDADALDLSTSSPARFSAASTNLNAPSDQSQNQSNGSGDGGSTVGSIARGVGGGGLGGSGTGGGPDEVAGLDGAKGTPGDGPVPDCTLFLREGRTSGSCVAYITSTKFSLPSSRATFDPAAIRDSAMTISSVMWSALDPVLEEKLREHQSQESDTPFSLRIHIVVGTDEVRHAMSLLTRARIESRFTQWGKQRLHDTASELRWSDSSE